MPVRTNLLPKFEEVDNTTVNMDANANANVNQNQNQPKIQKTKRLFSSVFRPLKMSDNPDPYLRNIMNGYPSSKEQLIQMLMTI